MWRHLASVAAPPLDNEHISGSLRGLPGEGATLGQEAAAGSSRYTESAATVTTGAAASSRNPSNS